VILYMWLSLTRKKILIYDDDLETCA